MPWREINWFRYSYVDLGVIIINISFYSQKRLGLEITYRIRDQRV